MTAKAPAPNFDMIRAESLTAGMLLSLNFDRETATVVRVAVTPGRTVVVCNDREINHYEPGAWHKVLRDGN